MKTCLLLALVTITGASAQAAEPQASATPDPALVDAIVRKLESDGTLERAVERAMTRGIQRQEENSGREHIRGEASAELSLTEYTDLQCPVGKRYLGQPA